MMITRKRKGDKGRKIQEGIQCSFKKGLLGFEDETWLYTKPYVTRTYMMKGEQQKIVHKGNQRESKRFHNITLLYPYNGIKFNMTGKTRNSRDFINHLKNIKRYVLKRRIKRFILVIDNASFHVSKKKNQLIISKANLNGFLSYIYQKKHRF